MARIPTWTNDELILALDLYVTTPAAAGSKTHPAVADLSNVLRSLPLHQVRPDPLRFRNSNSVYLKLQNFKAVDPDYPGAGMRAGAGPREHAVFARYAHDPAMLHELAGRIRLAAEALAGKDPDSGEDEGVPEGRLLARWHRQRERVRATEKKQKVLDATGRLACEACGFDFAAAYGSLGAGFAECHHTRPIAQGERITRLTDLAIVCSNCHRMLHRRFPMLTIAELRDALDIT